MTQKLQKWLHWSDVIRAEVESLVIAKHVFGEVRRIIQQNPRLHVPSSFYDHLSQTYVSHALMGLRRHVKSCPRSIGLAQLLGELSASPRELSRTYFVGLYKGSGAGSVADRAFNKYASPQSPHINPALVTADLAALRMAAKRCEDFADKRIAHRDRRIPKQVPTFKEIDECVDLLDRLCVKYLLLLRAFAPPTLLPHWQYDWQEIFRVPWIPGARKRPRRCPTKRGPV